MKAKIARMILRVSSDQQLEADGDLSVQRDILKEYINRHPDWILDEKEYFEGSNSAYKNTAEERDTLQEILQDAKNNEFDILVPYKDDRVGRLMLNTPEYILELKKNNVDVYSVKDGCISPKSADDIEGMMMLVFRYFNAQKSSKDTGMRVKDTMKKLVERGRFIGGKAPYGYSLEPSGEISKHGRVLKCLVIIPEKAKVVQYIYDLSLNKEYGSSKIASILNENEYWKSLAPNDYWKGGTITSILTNPIYTGRVAYNRRERIDGHYHTTDSKNWLISSVVNEEIIIIDEDTWNMVQLKRSKRNFKYSKSLEERGINVIKRNDGMLSLVDVLHCGYCGSKMVNGSKYNYWEIKGTGEKRASKTPVYRCQAAKEGIPHDSVKQFRADKIEPIIFDALTTYIEFLQKNTTVLDVIQSKQIDEKKAKEKELLHEKRELQKIQYKISSMEDKMPDAIIGDYDLSPKQLNLYIQKEKAKESDQKNIIKSKQEALDKFSITNEEWSKLCENIPTWKEVFMNGDNSSKRVLVNSLVERIDIKSDSIKIRFKINLDDYLPEPRMTNNGMVPKSRLRFYHYFFYRIRSQMDSGTQHL